MAGTSFGLVLGSSSVTQGCKCQKLRFLHGATLPAGYDVENLFNVP